MFATFTLNGFLLAMWVVHIPAITDRTGVSASVLGMLILLLAGAAIVGMRLAGPAADRFGSRTLVAVAATTISVTVIGPGLAGGPVTLALALACFGLGNGALDVSMNTQAVHVERAYQRPIMSAFHAMFSGGGFAGALVGAAAQRAGWAPELTLTCAGVAGLIITALLVPHLLHHPTTETSSRAEHYDPEPTVGPSPASRDASGHATASSRPIEPGPTTGNATSRAAEPSRTTEPVPEHSDRGHATAEPSSATEPDLAEADQGKPASGSRGRQSARARRVYSLGLIAFVLLLAEGVAGDWSALQVREHLGATEADAALAFGAFSATMTLGRFLADRVSGAFGPVAIVRYGSLLAAAGFAVVIASPWLPLTLAGWAMCGLGLAGGVPQIFSTAGNLGGTTAATDMSRVFTVGYLGLLAGPAMIGWLTALIPLTAALAVPLVLTLACAAAAKVVAR